jgi:O-methyltransferase
LTTPEPRVGPTLTEGGRRYLELLQRCLTRELFLDQDEPDLDPTIRAEGRDWPATADTMIGQVRLDHVLWCARTVIEEGVPGDLVECGIWRGGVVALFRAVLAAYDDTDRSVWGADSFAGLPVPDTTRYPADEGYDWSGVDALKVGADEVRANLARYGLLDDRVRLLEGWFEHTLPKAPIDALAVLRVDGDLYQSTMDVLTALEPKVSPGGFVIIDDYNGWEPCRKAVDDYRAGSGITAPMTSVDWMAVWWRKGESDSLDQ